MVAQIVQILVFENVELDPVGTLQLWGGFLDGSQRDSQMVQVMCRSQKCPGLRSSHRSCTKVIWRHSTWQWQELNCASRSEILQISDRAGCGTWKEKVLDLELSVSAEITCSVCAYSAEIMPVVL